MNEQTMPSPFSVRELEQLTDEIMTVEGLGPVQAANKAWMLMGDLLADVEQDARYRPARVVMFDLLTARELIEWTDR